MLDVEGYDMDETDLSKDVIKQMEVDEILLPQLSFHVINGSCSFQTMRMNVDVGTRTLFLVIDSGSTHNFLDFKVARKLGCLLKLITELKMTTTNGNELVYREICRSFKWDTQGHKFKANFLILTLDNYAMVLGIQWY